VTSSYKFERERRTTAQTTCNT